jgi:hypothetical protein
MCVKGQDQRQDRDRQPGDAKRHAHGCHGVSLPDHRNEAGAAGNPSPLPLIVHGTTRPVCSFLRSHAALGWGDDEKAVRREGLLYRCGVVALAGPSFRDGYLGMDLHPCGASAAPMLPTANAPPRRSWGGYAFCAPDLTRSGEDGPRHGPGALTIPFATLRDKPFAARLPARCTRRFPALGLPCAPPLPHATAP